MNSNGSAQPFGVTSGFTLIELMAIIVLLGVLLVFGVGSLNGVTARARADTAVAAIGNHIAYARSQALAASAQYAIVYEIGTGVISLIEPDETGRVLNLDTYIAEHVRQEWVLPRGVFIREVALADERFLQGQATVFVGPLGTVTYHLVYLSDQDGREMALEVSMLTGFVRRIESDNA